jgi:hypothetical protein
MHFLFIIIIIVIIVDVVGKIILTKFNICRRSHGHHIGVISSKRLNVSQDDASTGIVIILSFVEICQLVQNY